jgi:autotransporter-associated beta strand protein
MLSLTGGPSSVSQFFADGGVTNIPGTFKTTAKFTVRMGATVNASGTLTNTGSYTGFGDATDGTMNLTGGSFLSSPSLGTFIGNNSVGRLNISGGSFTIGTNSNFSIGNGYNNNGGGNGTLAISGSGSFSTGATTGNFLLGASGAGAGTGTIDLNGGTLATSRVITKGGGGGAAANVNFNGGVLRAEGTTAGIASNVTANVRNGGAVLDTNGFDVTLDANLAHSGLGGDAATDGGLRKRGAGNLILNGPLNSYNGKTAVEGGALTIYDPFLADSSDVVIAGGAVLNLDGLYNGAFTDTVGTLVIGGVPAAVGTWGAVGNASADFTSASITGAGMLRVTALGTAGSAFDSWISTNYPALTGSSALAGGDPDRDGASNLLEFALNGDPTSGANQGLEKVVIQDASAPAGKELTLVAAVRRGAAFASGAGGSQTATQDGVVYRIQGSLDLDNFASAVSHVATSDTAAGLPDLTGQAWEYHTFKLDASEGLGGKGFLRIRIEGAP